MTGSTFNPLFMLSIIYGEGDIPIKRSNGWYINGTKIDGESVEFLIDGKHYYFIDGDWFDEDMNPCEDPRP